MENERLVVGLDGSSCFVLAEGVVDAYMKEMVKYGCFDSVVVVVEYCCSENSGKAVEHSRSEDMLRLNVIDYGCFENAGEVVEAVMVE